jgi:hypothetical protein
MKKNNVVCVTGNCVPERLVKHMHPGEVAYTVEWAYNRDKNYLDENYPVGTYGGTMNLKVTCVDYGIYAIRFCK